MLTEILSPETMPKNNRKMAKGQRFIIGALGIGHGAWGIGNWAWGMGHCKEDLGTRRIRDKGKNLLQVLTSCHLVPKSPLLPTPLDKVNFVTMGRNVLQALALCQYLGRK